MLDSPAPRPRRWPRFLWDVTQTIVQAIVLYVLVAAIFGRFEIRQISMEPNFHEGQRVLVFQLGSTLSSLWVGTAHAAEGSPPALFAPRRGQVVILYTTPERLEEPLIKRVIAGPGDMIEITAGSVRVNGQPLDEPYVHGGVTNCFGQCGPLILADDEYFVMGDNRPNSRDSRSFGPIKAGQIVGRVVARYWPLSDLAFVP